MFNFRFARHFEGDHTERLSGQREPFTADDIAEPNYEVYAFSLCRRPRGRYGLVPILVGRTVHHLREPKDRKGIFVRSGYSVRLAYVDDPEDPEDGEFLTGCYARVLHIRRWLLLLPLLLAALILSLSLSLCSPSSSPDFLSGMTGTAGATSKPVVSVDYAAYDATVDSRWVADSMTQDFRLSLPSTCKYAKGKTGGNPILSSPSIWVDMDGNNQFSDNECVYNAPDKTGYGAFIRPGCEVNHIKLTQSVPAGTYSARTVWNSVLARDGKTPAGSTSFDFTLTVV
ncbi:MAG: hypothetical protein UC928_09855 [Collinsella sp.]|nr:hypothetical protein [Collinsella sp.]